jgi:crossover junction endodeoxyribonuclease RusA
VSLPPLPLLEVRVVGVPAPQGSKRGFAQGGRVRLVEASKAVAPWRADVVAAVLSAMQGSGWTPPAQVTVSIDFMLRRPPSAPKRRVLPCVKPDLDKLVRSTFDALTTSGVVTDDATICELHARKLYAAPGDPTGAVIQIADALTWQA